jgi:hypothetical protein
MVAFPPHQMEQLGLPRMACMSAEGRTSILVCHRHIVIPTNTIWPNVMTHTSRLRQRHLFTYYLVQSITANYSSGISVHSTLILQITGMWIMFVLVRPIKLQQTDRSWRNLAWTSRPNELQTKYLIHVYDHGKGKVLQLQTWTGPEGSRRLRLQDFKTIGTWGGKVVRPTHRPPSPPRNIPGTHFC